MMCYCVLIHLQDMNVNGVSHQVSTRRRDGTGSRMHYDDNTPIKLAKKDERSIIKCNNCIISKVTGILGKKSCMTALVMKFDH